MFTDPFVCRCLNSLSMPRFHTPLIKPDVRFSRIRLSDKDSRLRTLACSASCNFRVFLGVSRRIANLLFSVASYANLELRPLPSAGITRLHRYYEPIRHPKRPSLPLTGYRLDITNIHRIELPVLRQISLCIHAVATTPAETLGAVVHLP